MVALAHSAAPTFFPLRKIRGELFADGGLYANSPDHLALHEAEHFLEERLEDISVLSIGTTTSRFSFSNSGETDWSNGQTEGQITRLKLVRRQMYECTAAVE